MTTYTAVTTILLVHYAAVCVGTSNLPNVSGCPPNTTDLAEIKIIKSATNNLLSKVSLLLVPGHTPSHPACSSKEILQLAPQSPSGLYWISGTDNKPKHMYCDMERNCKGVAGGWMRVASIYMTKTGSMYLSIWSEDPHQSSKDVR